MALVGIHSKAARLTLGPLLFKNPSWDSQAFNFDTDVALAEKLDQNTLNAADPNLEKFFSHGGKLLIYHGWNDSVPARDTIDYYNKVLSAMGSSAKLNASIRLFLAPGMGHCGGGEGPDRFDTIAALEQWVENGKPPDRIIASRVSEGKVDRTRPLCPYPQVAKYTGTGSTGDAANFVCKEPSQ
jgi:feruloyl esterase